MIAKITLHHSQDRFGRLAVRVLREFGCFVAPDTLQAGKFDIIARRIVIAMSSHSAVAQIPGLQEVTYMTNETLFRINETPDHLIILGAGSIGVEMAQAHARTGIEVTLIEVVQILVTDDPELGDFVRRRLQTDGADILQNTSAQEIKEVDRKIIVRLLNEQDLLGSYVLVATGPAVNVESLELSRSGIAWGAKGIEINAGSRKTNKRGYATGDVSRGMEFSHTAAYKVGLVLRSALFGLPMRRRIMHLP